MTPHLHGPDCGHIAVAHLEEGTLRPHIGFLTEDWRFECFHDEVCLQSHDTWPLTRCADACSFSTKMQQAIQLESHLPGRFERILDGLVLATNHTWKKEKLQDGIWTNLYVVYPVQETEIRITSGLCCSLEQAEIGRVLQRVEGQAGIFAKAGRVHMDTGHVWGVLQALQDCGFEACVTRLSGKDLVMIDFKRDSEPGSPILDTTEHMSQAFHQALYSHVLNDDTLRVYCFESEKEQLLMQFAREMEGEWTLKRVGDTNVGKSTLKVLHGFCCQKEVLKIEDAVSTQDALFVGIARLESETVTVYYDSAHEAETLDGCLMALESLGMPALIFSKQDEYLVSLVRLEATELDYHQLQLIKDAVGEAIHNEVGNTIDWTIHAAAKCVSFVHLGSETCMARVKQAFVNLQRGCYRGKCDLQILGGQRVCKSVFGFREDGEEKQILDILSTKDSSLVHWDLVSKEHLEIWHLHNDKFTLIHDICCAFRQEAMVFDIKKIGQDQIHAVSYTESLCTQTQLWQLEDQILKEGSDCVSFCFISHTDKKLYLVLKSGVKDAPAMLQKYQKLLENASNKGTSDQLLVGKRAWFSLGIIVDRLLDDDEQPRISRVLHAACSSLVGRQHQMDYTVDLKRQMVFVHDIDQQQRKNQALSSELCVLLLRSVVESFWNDLALRSQVTSFLGRDTCRYTFGLDGIGSVNQIDDPRLLCCVVDSKQQEFSFDVLSDDRFACLDFVAQSLHEKSIPYRLVHGTGDMHENIVRVSIEQGLSDPQKARFLDEFLRGRKEVVFSHVAYQTKEVYLFIPAYYASDRGSIESIIEDVCAGLNASGFQTGAVKDLSGSTTPSSSAQDGQSTSKTVSYGTFDGLQPMSGNVRSILSVDGVCCASEVPLVNNICASIEGIDSISVSVISRQVVILHQGMQGPSAQQVPQIAAKRLSEHGFQSIVLVDGNMGESLASVKSRLSSSKSSPFIEWYTWAATLLWLVSFLSFVRPSEESMYFEWLSLGAVGLALPRIAYKSVQSLGRGMLDINTLMSIAVCGAVSLGEYHEAAAVTVIFSWSFWLEQRASARARTALQDLVDLRPTMARLETGEQVLVEQVKVGSRLIVRSGDNVPVDGMLVSHYCELDEASLTGESAPVTKTRGDVVNAGTVNVSPFWFVMESVATSDDSAVSRMIHLVEESAGSSSSTEQFIDRIARIYTPMVISLAICIGTIPTLFFGGPIHEWVRAALTILVIACPCALIISTPITYVSGLAKAAKLGFLIKGGKHFEVLSKIDIMASDKTGTLTQGEFNVNACKYLNNNMFTRDECLELLFNVEENATHPIATALRSYCQEHVKHIRNTNLVITDTEMIPGRGLKGVVASSGKPVLVLCTEAARGLEGTTHFDSFVRERSCFGETFSWLVVDNKVMMVLASSDRIRLSAKEFVQELQRSNIQVNLLTGDNELAARALHREIPGIHQIYYSLSPKDKVDKVHELKQAADGRQNIVAMIGDGINDAACMAAADVSLAMGVSGAPLAIESADCALMNNDLGKVPKLLALSRRVKEKIVQNVIISLGTKIAMTMLALTGHVGLGMAIFLDVGVMWVVTLNGVSLLTDTGLAETKPVRNQQENESFLDKGSVV